MEEHISHDLEFPRHDAILQKGFTKGHLITNDLKIKWLRLVGICMISNLDQKSEAILENFCNLKKKSYSSQ